MNRMKLLSDPEGKAFSFTFDDAGRRTAIIRSSGFDTRYEYDDAGQLTDLKHIRTSDQVVLSSAGYEYDAAGNRTKMLTPGGTHSYAYDNLNRLTRAEHPAGTALPNQVETFDYDGVGNRTADQGVTDYTYDAANRIQENSIYTFQHDADGNVTRRTAKTWTEDAGLVYNSENQLKRVDLPDGSQADFGYDGMGRRLEKDLASTQGTLRKRYVYDGEDILAIVNPNDSNNLVALFTHGPGIDEPLKMNGPQGEIFFLADGLGSIVALTDANNNVVERIQYQAYGSPVFIDMRTQTPTYSDGSWTSSPYAFTGREWDSEVGLYYFRARFYEPNMARFLQEDSFSRARVGPSQYLYSRANPGTLIDPTGTSPISPLVSLINIVATPSNAPSLNGTDTQFPVTTSRAQTALVSGGIASAVAVGQVIAGDVIFPPAVTLSAGYFFYGLYNNIQQNPRNKYDITVPPPILWSPPFPTAWGFTINMSAGPSTFHLLLPSDSPACPTKTRPI